MTLGAPNTFNPNKPPLGRQPWGAQMAPSKRYPWYGSIVSPDVVHGAMGPLALTGGERFTQEQAAALAAAKLDPDTVPTMTVRRQLRREELYWPRGELPPVMAFDCPIIGKQGDKIKVIAPDGRPKMVQADGWGHRPYRTPRDYYGCPTG